MKLINSEVFLAIQALQKIGDLKIPVKASLALAKLKIKLNEENAPIEEVRNGLIKKYGQPDERGGIRIKGDSSNWSKFAEEFDELMKQETKEFVFEVVKLPEKVASTCDKCNHNMDRPLEIEPNILINLVKFVEII